MRWLPFLAAAAVAACSDGAMPTAPITSVPVAPRATAGESATTPIAFAFANPCNGEPIAFTGTQTVTFNTTTTGSGNTGYRFTITQNVSGTGGFGNFYNAQFQYTDALFTADPFPLILTFYTSSNVIGTGSGTTNPPNFALTLHIKLTINAGGVPTAEIEHTRTACRGPELAGFRAGRGPI